MTHVSKESFSNNALKFLIAVILITIQLFSWHTTVSAAKGDEDDPYIIATDTTYAPFEFVNSDGELVGIDVDIMKAIAEDQGFHIDIQVLGFSAAVQALEAGQADGVIAGMGITEERQDSFDFSTPYYESSVHFAVNADSDIQFAEDLEGETVAVKAGTTGANAAQQQQDELGYEIRTFEDTATMYEDVLSGNSAAAVEDFPVIQYAINTGQVDFRVLDHELISQPFGFAVNKDENQELLEMFNNGLENIQADGTYDEIIDTYLSAEATEENQAPSGILGTLQQHGGALLDGLWQTIWIAFVGFFIALILGLLIGLMSTSQNTLIKGISTIYVNIFRSVPLLVLSFFVYFGIPQLLGITITNIAAGIIALSVNASAYISEIFRGGINAVDYEQLEAGQSLGLSRNKSMRHIILPQAFRIMVPSFLNQFVMTLKDTSILSVIGIVELTQTGRIIIARTYQSGAVWITIALMYIILITVLTYVSNRIDNKLNSSHTRTIG